jgi:hypothetical protein
MSIATSTYDRDGQHIVEWHADHLGGRYTQSWFAPAAWTEQQIADRLAAHAAQIELALAEGEVEELLG